MEAEAAPRTAMLLRVLRFPLTSMLVLYFGLYHVYASGVIYMVTTAHGPIQPLVVGLLTVANLLLVYVSFARVVEQRPVRELALPSMGRELGLGLLLGSGLFATCVLIAMALGVCHIHGIDQWHHLLPTGVALALPFYEELVFRGVVFRILEVWFGSWLALVVSSVVFGLVHLSNTGESTAGVLAIVCVLGPWLVAPYLVTRRLWMSIGLHAAWNYTMGKVFSINVSGVPGQGLLTTTLAGPELLTGGRAGMEGSLIAIVVCALSTVVLLALAVRRGHIVPPSWSRGFALTESGGPTR